MALNTSTWVIAVLAASPALARTEIQIRQCGSQVAQFRRRFGMDQVQFTQPEDHEILPGRTGRIQVLIFIEDSREV